MRRLIAAAGLFLAMATAACAEAPPWRTNYPLDGRHAYQSVVTLSSTTSTVIFSTDSIRASHIVQFRCPSTSDVVYWSPVSASSTTSPSVPDGSYLSLDDPIAWQGALYGQGSAANCKAYITTWRKEGL